MSESLLFDFRSGDGSYQVGDRYRPGCVRISVLRFANDQSVRLSLYHDVRMADPKHLPIGVVGLDGMFPIGDVAQITTALWFDEGGFALAKGIATVHPGYPFRPSAR